MILFTPQMTHALSGISLKNRLIFKANIMLSALHIQRCSDRIVVVRNCFRRGGRKPQRIRDNPHAPEIKPVGVEADGDGGFGKAEFHQG